MKKALIVTTVSGFILQFEMNNVELLKQLGYEVHYASNFLVQCSGKDDQKLKELGLVCHQVDFERFPFAYKENAKAFRQLRKLMQQENFSLIHCHTPVGAALTRIVSASLWKKREYSLVYTAHGFHFYKGAPLKFWLLFYPIECLLASYTDVLITINQEDYERAKRFCKYKKTRVEFVPGVGIDMAYWSGETLSDSEKQEIRKTAREELGVLEEEQMLLSVGELISRKNHVAVIEQLAQKEDIEKVKYFICGQGVLQEELQELINSNHLEERVVLLGFRKDIRKLLYASDLFVFPSKQEGLPVALMEAMAAGVEVAASDIRGNRDLLQCPKKDFHVFDCSNVKKRMRQIYESLQ